MGQRFPTLAAVEQRHILSALHFFGNNRTHAAKALGISIRGLRMKLRQYETEGVSVPTPIFDPTSRSNLLPSECPQASDATAPFHT
jgi:Bacterial regulatory protein, Fis family